MGRIIAFEAFSSGRAPSESNVGEVTISVNDTNLDLTLKVLARAYQMVGADTPESLRRLGARCDGLPMHLPRDVYCAAWADIAARSGRPDIGLEVAADLPLGSMGRLEWGCRSAETIGDALATLAECGRLMHTGGFYEYEEGEREVAFVYRPSTDSALPRAVIDWSMGYVLRIIRHEARERLLSGLRVQLQYPAPADSRRSEAFFDCPVIYEASSNAIFISCEVADRSLEHYDPETYRAIVEVLKLRLEGLSQTTFVEQLESSVLRELRAGRDPALQKLARTMGVSERSLQRRLSEESMTYRGLVERVRAREASRLLRAPGATVTDVALTLGYSAPSALYRVFRRHFGCSPTDYARQA